MLRHWFWQLAAASQGPDWLFAATFASPSATRLAELVRQQALTGFAHLRVADQPCRYHPEPHAYDLYVDERNAAALAANLAGQASRNLWIYHTVEVCGPHLTIERGYGGYPDSHGATETDLIVALAQAPDLALQSWEIGYGGQGYPAGQVASGTAAAELLAYLQDE